MVRLSQMCVFVYICTAFRNVRIVNMIRLNVKRSVMLNLYCDILIVDSKHVTDHTTGRQVIDVI